MTATRNLSTYRPLITRTVILYYLLFIFWRAYAHLLPFQLQSPVISKVHYDATFWLFRFSGLDGFVVHNMVGGIILSVVVALSGVLSLVYPTRRLFLVPFTLSYFVLAVVYNIYLCHSAHYLGGMVLLSAAFWPRQDENFNLLWEGMRYYACWVYGSAFIWKVLGGAFFQWDAGMLTFKSNLAEYLYQNPDTSLANFYYYFLQHPVLVNVGHKVVFLAEGAFLIGFLTKKFDGLLIVMAFFIFSSIYLFSDVFFAELLIIVFPLLSQTAWTKLGSKIPLLCR
jgi:hypothetical protein